MDADDLPCGGPEGLKVPAVAKMWAILREPHAITYYCPDPRRGMLLIATPALLDFHRAVATMTDEEQGISHRMATEWMFRFCDRVTRRTGYLTKYVRIIDLSGIRLSHISRDFQRRDAQIAKLLEEHYPQLLGNVFLCHAPGFMHAVFAGLRQLMPRRVVEKVDFLQPRRSARDRSRLLEGVSTTFIPRAIWLALTAPQERVNADITDIIDWAGTAVENVDTSRVAVAGFCYGGGKALRYCAKQRVDAAAVVFYGSPLTDPLDYVDLRAPVLGIFGTEDVQIPQRKVDQFRAAMEEAGVEHEVQSYYGVGHAFWSDMGQIDRQEMPQFAAWGLATNFLKTFFEGRESFSRRRAFLEFMLQEEGRGELYEGGDETLAAEDTDVVNDGSESGGGPDTGP